MTAALGKVERLRRSTQHGGGARVRVCASVARVPPAPLSGGDWRVQIAHVSAAVAAGGSAMFAGGTSAGRHRACGCKAQRRWREAHPHQKHTWLARGQARRKHTRRVRGQARHSTGGLRGHANARGKRNTPAALSEVFFTFALAPLQTLHSSGTTILNFFRFLHSPGTGQGTENGYGVNGGSRGAGETGGAGGRAKRLVPYMSVWRRW